MVICSVGCANKSILFSDSDGFTDDYDTDCPIGTDRFFMGIDPTAGAYEITVGDMTVTSNDLELTGNIGFLDVTVTDSVPSTNASFMTGTLIDALVLPAAIVIVPASAV